jgi:hypothetical protein
MGGVFQKKPDRNISPSGLARRLPAQGPAGAIMYNGRQYGETPSNATPAKSDVLPQNLAGGPITSIEHNVYPPGHITFTRLIVLVCAQARLKCSTFPSATPGSFLECNFVAQEFSAARPGVNRVRPARLCCGFTSGERSEA